MTKEQQQDWLDALDNFEDDMDDILGDMGDLASRIDATVGEMKSAGMGYSILEPLRRVARVLSDCDNGDISRDIADDFYSCRGGLENADCEEGDTE